LSRATEFLNEVKNYGKKFDSESNAKARIRVGEIKNTEELSLYVSTKANRKTKKIERLEEGRKDENKTKTTNRAITILRSIADSLADQNRLSTAEVNKVFSIIEKQGYISVNDASTLLDLLETGRRAAYKIPSFTHADSHKASDTPSILHINTNPFEDTPIEESHSNSVLPTSNVTSNNPFENISTQENKTTFIDTASATIIQTTHAERSTNPFDDAPTNETQNLKTAPPTFFQKVADFLKPVTNFFASVRRFFGFN
jgi:hypothetical protein